MYSRRIVGTIAHITDPDNFYLPQDGALINLLPSEDVISRQMLFFSFLHLSEIHGR